MVHPGRAGLDPNSVWLAEHTNPERRAGTLREALVGADVFIGVSAPRILTGDDVATMAERSIVFALANPDPEVDPAEARRTAAVVATGRSDEPNQINNVLAFPGVFAACWTPAPATSTCVWRRRPHRRWPTSWRRISSTPPSSSRASSTHTSSARSRTPCVAAPSGRPQRELDVRAAQARRRHQGLEFADRLRGARAGTSERCTGRTGRARGGRR